MKKVQITQELFVKLVQYHIFGIYDTENEIKKELEQKINTLVKRDLYGRYKTAPTESEREQARQEYLDSIGIHQDYRW